MEKRIFDMSDFIRGNDFASEDASELEKNRCGDALTMVFINMQPLEGVYPLDESFDNGTLFPSLNKPWEV